MPSRHEALAVSLLRQVVDDPDAAPTDQLTAQGLLASTYAEAERCFEGALAQDAFHPYATVYLVSTSLLAGRLEKAAAHAHVWQMMSRKDPAPLLYEGFILALLGKHHEAKQVMKGINIPAGGGPVLSNQTFAAYQAVMDIAAAIQDMLAEALLDPIARLKFVVLLATKLPAAVGGFAKTGVFRVPLTPAQRQAFHQFLEAVKLGNLPFQAQPVVALERLHGDNPFVPAGLVLFFRGKCHLDLGDKAKAAEAFEQAATQPAFFDIRRLCWLAVANYRVGLATRAKPDDAERLKRAARVLIRQAVVLGTMTAAFREKVIGLLIQSDGLDFAEELAAEGGNQKTLEKVQRLRGAR